MKINELLMKMHSLTLIIVLLITMNFNLGFDRGYIQVILFVMDQSTFILNFRYLDSVSLKLQQIESFRIWNSTERDSILFLNRLRTGNSFVRAVTERNYKTHSRLHFTFWKNWKKSKGNFQFFRKIVEIRLTEDHSSS